MSEIAGDVLSANDRRNELTIKRARKYDSMLARWYRQLPNILQPKNIVLPNHLQLQYVRHFN